ncbi:hypothetical protein [Deinococcus arcticus]|uniref:Uncharacterized protein n=1 Tax=Deinococcus arcticus TaxID=2136176 RepID=A0A2T3WA91_9DEIO|nr:hypothetical protein [Deinococcus arcticus]PTA68816.1 hypothetical protein C8263_06160 [Deinococcus arcticus]
MTLLRTLTLTSREDAARADQEANWAKTPQQRLAEIEFLRRQTYPERVAPRLERVLKMVEREPIMARGATET